jgi:hypothetical protein
VLPDGGKFIVCSQRGAYLRHPAKGYRKPPVRRFRSAFEAAIEAEYASARERR